MCQALMELLKDQIDEKVNTAVDVAVDETSERDIKSLMDTLHLSADEAMDILKIPAEKRKIYVVNL